MIGVVIPAGGTDTSTEILPIGQVELGQQIEAIGNNVALIELPVGLIEVRVVHDLLVLILHSEAQVVAHRIVPPQAQIRISDIEFHRCDPATAAHDYKSQTAAYKRPIA
ncbi:hypothetical protein D3C84_1057620 [compost metagenome]